MATFQKLVEHLVGRKHLSDVDSSVRLFDSHREAAPIQVEMELSAGSWQKKPAGTFAAIWQNRPMTFAFRRFWSCIVVSLAGAS
jgi:hypothetical protein